MQDNNFFLKNLWRWKCEIEEFVSKKVIPIDIEQLRKSEWSDIFEKLMRNRRIMGAIRYGKTNDPNKPKYDRINTMRKKIDLYEISKNKEVLVDLAVYAMVEFQEPTIAGTYFEATDDQHHDIIK